MVDFGGGGWVAADAEHHRLVTRGNRPEYRKRAEGLSRADKAEWAVAFTIGLSACGAKGSVGRYRHCACSGDRLLKFLQ